MILKTVLGDTEVSGDFSVLPHEYGCIMIKYTDKFVKQFKGRKG